MLSGKELLQHSFFSALAAFAVLAGLYGAVKASWANEVHVDTHLLGKKFTTALVFTLVLAAIIFIMQKVDLRLGFFWSVIIIYLPAFICLGWAIDVYIRGVLMVS